MNAPIIHATKQLTARMHLETMFAHVPMVWLVILYQLDAVHLANVSQTVIVPAMLHVKMLVAPIHAKIQALAVKMLCAQ